MNRRIKKRERSENRRAHGKEVNCKQIERDAQDKGYNERERQTEKEVHRNDKRMGEKKLR